MQIESWKNWFQPHILERGRAYFEEDRVSVLERTEDGYTATVEGTEEYEVEILLDGDSIDICSVTVPMRRMEMPVSTWRRSCLRRPLPNRPRRKLRQKRSV